MTNEFWRQSRDQPVTPSAAASGPHAGHGAAYDEPYRFGRMPTSLAPYPFSTRQYVRLLILRSRVHAGLVGCDDRRAG